MRVDALHPIPQHVAAGNLKARLVEQVVQVEKAARFSMVERLGLGQNLLKPILLLLGVAAEQHLMSTLLSSFSRKKQAFSARSMLIFET